MQDSGQTCTGTQISCNIRLSYLGACLRDSKVLQRCGWWETMMPPVQSITAQSTQAAADGNQAVRAHMEACIYELSIGIWWHQNVDLFYGWLWKRFLVHSIWGNFTKNQELILMARKKKWIPFFSKCACQKKEDTSGNICSEWGIACMMGVKLQTIFSSMCGRQ